MQGDAHDALFAKGMVARELVKGGAGVPQESGHVSGDQGVDGEHQDNNGEGGSPGAPACLDDQGPQDNAEDEGKGGRPGLPSQGEDLPLLGNEVEGNETVSAE